MKLSDGQQDRALNTGALPKKISELHPHVEKGLRSNCQRIRDARSKGFPPNLTEGDLVLVTRDDFTSGEKLSLRWCGPHRVLKAFNNLITTLIRLKDLAMV